MSSIPRMLVAPLVNRSTYLRSVHLLLGAALLLPFFMLDTVFSTQLLPHAADFPSVVAVLALIALGCVIVLPPVATAITAPTRAVEVTAAAALLDSDLPAYPINGPQSWADRWRTVVWFGLHLALGGVVGVAALIGLPVAFALMAALFNRGADLDIGILRLPQPTGWGLVGVPLAGVALAVGIVYLASGLGAVLARLAPTLLGASPADRVLELEQQTEQLAERNRLARELHDSVGHALTITTIQAAAAQRVLESDPEFARRALTAIEDAGRAALADLDHVLGLLRDSGPSTVPQPTLADLQPLLDKTRTVGVEVHTEVSGRLDAVPAVVSREAYRIVQEGLTNALRYAGKVPVSLRLTVREDRLELELANPLEGGASSVTAPNPLRQWESGGRGLRGIRERVAVLHGQLEAGVDNSTDTGDGDVGAPGAGHGGKRWRIAARIPLRAGLG